MYIFSFWRFICASVRSENLKLIFLNEMYLLSKLLLGNSMFALCGSRKHLLVVIILSLVT